MTVERTAAAVAKRAKTGGRKAGVPNKPKVDGAPVPQGLFAPIKESPFPPYKLARVESLVAYDRNPRTHSPAQIDNLARLITEYGWTNPVLVDGKRGVVAGHGRVLAAKKLGMDVVPTIELRHLTAAQKRAYVIADNASALQAGWDEELLASELGELEDLGFDLTLTGLGEAELVSFMAHTGEGLTDPDDVPLVETATVSRLGDIWICGPHRVGCGDSANVVHVAALMDGAEADLCFTSPPYAQQRDYKGEAPPWDTLMQGVFGALPAKHGAQVLVNLGLIHREGEWVPYWDGWIEWMRAAGWRRFGWYIWDQGFGLPGDWNGRLAPSHEFVFHFNRETERARKSKAKKPENIKIAGGSTMRGKDGVPRAFSHPENSLQPTKVPDSVIRVTRQVGRISKTLDHPAVFPVALTTEVLNAFSDAGDVTFDPFLGSGSQLIGAHTIDRICYGMEIAPEYTDVAIRRWQAFTGLSAVHATTGATFDATAAERLAA